MEEHPAVYIAIALVAVLVLFNQVQVNALSAAADQLTRPSTRASLSGTARELGGIDLDGLQGTAQNLAAVFPELQGATDEQAVMTVLFPTGTPEYTQYIGGANFDDPINSLTYLSQWFPTIKDEVKRTDPDAWNRYLELAAKPHGLSCEYCCGVGPIAAASNGESLCGCQHNPALLAVTLSLLHNTDYSDAQVVREVMRWKTLFFPRDMVGLGMQVAGTDPSSIKALPGMVGGC